MLISCKYCGGIHREGEHCKSKPKTNTSSKKFRSTKKWTDKAIQIKQRDRYLCQICLKDNKYKYDGLEVHHIIPIHDDYNKRLDDDNLITLCSKHHKQAEVGEISVKELQEAIPPTNI